MIKFFRTCRVRRATKTSRPGERGSVVTYLLIAIFLIGLLTLTLSEGPKKNATTQQLDSLTLSLQSDLDMIEASVNDCVLIYPSAVDINNDGAKNATDNANAPFPLTYTTASGYAASGPIASAICPGAPPTPLVTPAAPGNKQLIIGQQAGRSFRVLGDTANYTTTYSTDATEGVMLKITSVTANALWAEAASRIDQRYSACKAAISTAAAQGCSNTCLYFWIKRLPTSSTTYEAGCP